MTSRLIKRSNRPIYPAYCFTASPTYNVWVKLTAADVHALRYEPGFDGQNVYFYLNHPIRYVRLVGTIVAINDFPKLAIVTLDDGSGQTIEVKFARLPEEITSSVDCPSNTTVDTVNVTTGLGVFRVFADGTELDVATTVKVKGTITSFWNKRQLELKRISIVGSTNEEVSAWAELAAFKRDVLSTPWHLDRQKLDEIEEERRAKKQQEEEQEEQERERHAKKRARRRVHEEKMRVYEAKLEKRRRQEEVMMNAGALDGSDIINWPP